MSGGPLGTCLPVDLNRPQFSASLASSVAIALIVVSHGSSSANEPSTPIPSCSHWLTPACWPSHSSSGRPLRLPPPKLPLPRRPLEPSAWYGRARHWAAWAVISHSAPTRDAQPLRPPVPIMRMVRLHPTQSVPVDPLASPHLASIYLY
jgi:hypothetical protein